MYSVFVLGCVLVCVGLFVCVGVWVGGLSMSSYTRGHSGINVQEKKISTNISVIGGYLNMRVLNNQEYTNGYNIR